MKQVITVAPRSVLASDAREYVQASKASNTTRAYKAAWREFAQFCETRSVVSLPALPETIIAYATWLARRVKPSTIQVKLAAISFAHRTAKQSDPTGSEDVRIVMSGIRRKLGMAPQKKAPATREDLVKMMGALPDDLGGIRNKALVLIGFSGAFRRSELVGLDVADVHFGDSVMTITLKRSKTDQEGRGMIKVIPYVEGELDPASALRAWLNASSITSGPIFRKVDKWGQVREGRMDGGTVARIVKSCAESAGLEPRQFAGHSLRIGFITTAAQSGAAEWEIQEVSGHKSERVLRGYIRDAGVGGQNAIRRALGEKL